jgi:hypothetical protein
MEETMQVGPSYPISISSSERVSQLGHVITAICFHGRYERRLKFLGMVDREFKIFSPSEEIMDEIGLRSGRIWALWDPYPPLGFRLPCIRFELRIQ